MGFTLRMLISLVLVQSALGAFLWPTDPTEQVPPTTDTQVIITPVPVKFMGVEHSTLYVSKNGVVGFGSSAAADVTANTVVASCVEQYGAFIAPLWTQYDSGTFHSVTATDSTGNSNLLDDASATSLSYQMIKYFENSLSLKYTSTKYALHISWRDMMANSLTNTFEMFLMTDGCQTYVALNYFTIGYDGDAGLPETSPNAIISDGLGGAFGDYGCYALPDSGTKQIDNLVMAESNSHDSQGKGTGWFVFRVDSTQLYIGTTDTPFNPLQLCIAEGCDTCGTTSCQSCGSAVDTVTCKTTSWYDGCWTAASAATSACMYQCERNSPKLCPAPCGGCGVQTSDLICDDCTTSVVETTCNNKRCNFNQRLERYVRLNGDRVTRNRKCCYSYRFPGNPRSLGRRKSCCRPKVFGFVGGRPRCR